MLCLYYDDINVVQVGKRNQAMDPLFFFFRGELICTYLNGFCELLSFFEMASHFEREFLFYSFFFHKDLLTYLFTHDLEKGKSIFLDECSLEENCENHAPLKNVQFVIHQKKKNVIFF